MRQWLISRIPHISKGVGWLTPEIIHEYTTDSFICRIFILLDVLLGQFGSPVIYITISSRTAKRCQDPQNAPLWALILGVLLEKIEPGHLQKSVIADCCRAQRTLQELL